MKNLFFFILTISTLKVAGQSTLLGVKGGVSSTNITSSNFLSQNNSRTALTVGLTYEFLIKKHFSIGADLIYNQRGFTNDIVLHDIMGNPTGEKNTASFNYDYISLPIKTGFYIGNKLYGFANIGVIPSLLADAKTIVPGYYIDGKLTEIEVYDITNRVSKFDFAGLVEIGGGYRLNGRYWIYTSFSYQNSFTTITNSDYFSFSKIHHNGMNLTIGLKCALAKK
jgi:hypothetical protein